MIDVYLLVPENFAELALKTNLKKEELRNMYEYDQQFGLVSKIYLVEKKS